MSTKEDTSLDHSSNGQSLVVHQAAPLGVKDIDWGAVPGYAAGPGAAPTDPSTYLHAIRRHWLLGLVLGVMLGGIATLATWVLIPKKYTATAIIEVSRVEPSIIAPKIGGTQQDYDTFKNTQLQHMRTPAVITAALRDQEINNLPIVQREKADQIKWLRDYVSVSYPGGAEIMEVSLSDIDPKQVTKIVDALVDAYMTEIVERDRRLNDQKLAELRNVQNLRDAEIRNQQRVFERRVEELGTADKDTLILQNNIRMQQLGMYRNQLARVQLDLRQYRSDYRAAEGALQRLNESPAISVELEGMRQKDPFCRELEKQMAQLQQMLASQNNVVKVGAPTSTLSSQLGDQLAVLQDQYRAHLEGLQHLVVEGKRVQLQDTMADRALLAELAAAEEKTLMEEITKLQTEFETVGKSTVELEMAQMTLDQLKEVRNLVANKLETLKVEMGSLPRIRRGPPAQEPKSANNVELKFALSILAGLVGLVLPGFIVVRWDVHKQRVNSSEDVAKKLGLPVIGSVPVIPGRAIKRLHAPSKANHQWNVRLAESIDGIAAKLLRNASLDKDRVVLITSAVSGEGKTTLATQIAMSLARAGRNTVLVDFDLRRPAIDKAFQLPLHPGVSEALCGEADVKSLAQPTGLANLEVITAGRCDRHVLQALANGGDKRLFDELREAYDFVIVDGSPILPVADSRYLSQHVDSVLLSVFRDYSRMPKVTAAREILEAFGVHDVEAVVTSSSEGGYGVVDMAARAPQASA